ncbi:MAG: hypothetical protein ACK51T_01125, partial [bacterium]
MTMTRSSTPVHTHSMGAAAPVVGAPPSAPTGGSGGAGSILDASDTGAQRHIGPGADEIAEMLAVVGFDDIESCTGAGGPGGRRDRSAMHQPVAVS